MSLAKWVTTLGLCLASSTASAAPSAADVDNAAAKTVARAVEEYRWFHANPELSDHEEQTAAHLAALLSGMGLTVHTKIGGHGVVAVLKSGSGGPVVLYRADMDALPVTENTGLAYASKNVGVMHACGHDVHMATAFGVLQTLVDLKGQWNGTVLFVGQPAEELGSGARAMLDDPRFAKIIKEVGTPKVALAIHDAADVPAGDVSILPGFDHANVDSVDIILHGKGGHGARPHEAIDPIVMGAEVVMSLQTIVSRRLAPQEKAVVTVGKFDAGTKHNIIPPKATLLLTVRSYGDDVRKTLLAEIERIARQIAKAHRAPRAPEIKLSEGLPAAYNDPEWTERVRKQLVAVVGEAHVRTHLPSLGGEDFGLLHKQLGIPGVMYLLGGADPKRFAKAKGQGLPGLHSDQWAPADTPTLRTGIRTMTAAILDALQ